MTAKISGFVRLGARKLTRKEFYQPNPFVYPYTILHLDLKTWLRDRQFQEEAFGPVSIFVTLENERQFVEAMSPPDCCNCIGMFSDNAGADSDIYRDLEPVIRQKTARLANDRMPGCSILPHGMYQAAIFRPLISQDSPSVACRPQFSASRS